MVIVDRAVDRTVGSQTESLFGYNRAELLGRSLGTHPNDSTTGISTTTPTVLHIAGTVGAGLKLALHKDKHNLIDVSLVH
jgi:hypothetical protein